MENRMKVSKQDKQMLAEEFGKAWSEDSGMVDWCVKNVGGFWESSDGQVVTIDKPHVETEFWFGEHTYDYDEVVDFADKCSRDEGYFIAKNLSRTEAARHIYNMDETARDAYIVRHNMVEDCRISHVEWALPWEVERIRGDYRKMTDDEVREFREVLDGEQEKFRKRLGSYLKRYGLSKCHFGVYWADR